MDALALLKKHFAAHPTALAIVTEHSLLVAKKAVHIAENIGLSCAQKRFVEEAALLHDIGIVGIHAPEIGCTGEAPYICHGIIGREILEHEGLPAHAMVCERHIGVGLSLEDIDLQKLPLPRRCMSPKTIEERIICFADLFFSKKPGSLSNEKSQEDVRSNLYRFGTEKAAIFDAWVAEFSAEKNFPKVP